MKINLKTIFCGLILFSSASVFGQSNEVNNLKTGYGNNAGGYSDFRTKKPKPANSTITITQDYVHKVGEEFEGGIIFKLWKDSLNVEHGLIVSTINVSSGIEWSNINSLAVGKAAFDKIIGSNNLNGIVNQKGHITSAAFICDQFVHNGKSDWFLPSYSELTFLMEEMYLVNKGLQKIKGAELIKPELYHWSSTEFDDSHVFVVSRVRTTGEGILSLEWQSKYALKRNCYTVRAVRTF